MDYTSYSLSGQTNPTSITYSTEVAEVAIVSDLQIKTERHISYLPAIGYSSKDTSFKHLQNKENRHQRASRVVHAGLLSNHMEREFLSSQADSWNIVASIDSNAVKSSAVTDAAAVSGAQLLSGYLTYTKYSDSVCSGSPLYVEYVPLGVCRNLEGSISQFLTLSESSATPSATVDYGALFNLTTLTYSSSDCAGTPVETSALRYFNCSAGTDVFTNYSTTLDYPSNGFVQE